MAYTFLKASGIEIGSSLLDEESIDFCKNVLKKYSDKIILPIDSVNALEISDEVTPRECFINEIKENEIEIHLKGLAKSLGYKLVKLDGDFEEDSEIGLLKDLAAYKKGAILSELYNAYIDFNNVSKENLEAIINNFFTSLKLQGFEVDDTKGVGDKVSLDTKDLLSDFVLTNPINEKGIIEGQIKYLSWMYKGKKVTPMVVKPLNK